MLAFTDQSEKITGYLYNNAIVDTNSLNVLGVILGNCVFSREYRAVGKFLNNTLYDEDSAIVARVTEFETDPPYDFDAAECTRQAWDIATKTTQTTCPWVEPGEEWSSRSLRSLLGVKRVPA